ncbi:MAG: amino acid ABC transporter permease [Chloroflexi bacterium]|nr:amino acid ABC transporter permease [Chloroflexota bacterium]
MNREPKQYSSGEVLAPPTERYTILGWLHKNLFSTWYYTLLTLVTLYILYAILKPSLIWIFTQAQWEVVVANLRLFMVGQYPKDQIFRIWLALDLLAFTVGLAWALFLPKERRVGAVLVIIPLLLASLPFISSYSRINWILFAAIGVAGWALGRWQPKKMRRPLIVLMLGYFPILILLISGFEPILKLVKTNYWGGLLLTMLLAVVGITLSFPLGILLALGRQSELPIVKTFSILYIEMVRGVPLVTILFMAQLMLPLFLPPGMKIDNVLRAMAGMVLFAAAYMAENVRGGLQAIPKGQHEAAWALGLNGFQTMFYIILPQALRNVIPVIVGQFIALFKDTSLVAIVGLLDLLGIASTVLAQPEFIGRQREVYLFIALIYWVFSYAMSYASRRLEVALGVGER